MLNCLQEQTVVNGKVVHIFIFLILGRCLH